MTQYPLIRITSPSDLFFEDRQDPQQSLSPTLPKQTIHRSRVSVVNDQEDNLPKGCQFNIRKRHLPTKGIIHYKRRRYYTLSNVQKIDQNMHEDDQSAEIGQSKRKMTEHKTLKEKHKEDMKEINRNYYQFMREFKKTKPLYLLKEEEFQQMERATFEIKREEVLRKLREYYKPICFEEIDQHERAYLRFKQNMNSNGSNYINVEPVQQSKQSPKLIQLRDKQPDIELNEAKFSRSKQKYKEGEVESISKMRENYDRIINRSKVNTMQSGSQKRKISDKIDPATIQTYESVNRREHNRVHSKSLNCQSRKSAKFHQPNKLSSLFVTEENSPKHRAAPRYQITQLKKVQKLNNNQPMNQQLRQSYHLARFGKGTFLEQNFALDNEFIDSVRQKVLTLQSKAQDT